MFTKGKHDKQAEPGTQPEHKEAQLTPKQIEKICHQIIAAKKEITSKSFFWHKIKKNDPRETILKTFSTNVETYISLLKKGLETDSEEVQAHKNKLIGCLEQLARFANIIFDHREPCDAHKGEIATYMNSMTLAIRTGSMGSISKDSKPIIAPEKITKYTGRFAVAEIAGATLKPKLDAIVKAQQQAIATKDKPESILSGKVADITAAQHQGITITIEEKSNSTPSGKVAGADLEPRLETAIPQQAIAAKEKSKRKSPYSYQRYLAFDALIEIIITKLKKIKNHTAAEAISVALQPYDKSEIPNDEKLDNLIAGIVNDLKDKDGKGLGKLLFDTMIPGTEINAINFILNNVDDHYTGILVVLNEWDEEFNKTLCHDILANAIKEAGIRGVLPEAPSKTTTKSITESSDSGSSIHTAHAALSRLLSRNQSKTVSQVAPDSPLKSRPGSPSHGDEKTELTIFDVQYEAFIAAFKNSIKAQHGEKVSKEIDTLLENFVDNHGISKYSGKEKLGRFIHVITKDLIEADPFWLQYQFGMGHEKHKDFGLRLCWVLYNLKVSTLTGTHYGFEVICDTVDAEFQKKYIEALPTNPHLINSNYIPCSKMLKSALERHHLYSSMHEKSARTASPAHRSPSPSATSRIDRWAPKTNPASAMSSSPAAGSRSRSSSPVGSRHSSFSMPTGTGSDPAPASASSSTATSTDSSGFPTTSFLPKPGPL